MMAKKKFLVGEQVFKMVDGFFILGFVRYGIESDSLSIIGYGGHPRYEVTDEWVRVDRNPDGFCPHCMLNKWEEDQRSNRLVDSGAN